MVGGSVVDITSTLDAFEGVPSNKIENYLNTSSPGIVKISMGGVGRNVAETTFRLGLDPIFVSAVGNDGFGNWFITQLQKIGMVNSNAISLKFTLFSLSFLIDSKIYVYRTLITYKLLEIDQLLFIMQYINLMEIFFVQWLIWIFLMKYLLIRY